MNVIPVIYLSSYALSVLGNSIAGIALPLIVLQVTGSALGAGAVAAAGAVPAILAGLFMGVVIDRINRRTSSIITDLVSSAAVAALPLIDMISGLSLGWFILFGIIGSLGDVPGMTAREALLPAIVRHGGMSSERLVGLREALGAIALLVGPAAAGTLMVLFDGSVVLWITAGTSLAAALLTLLIPHRVGRVTSSDGSPVDATSTGGLAQLRDGWRVLFTNRFLLTTTVLSLVSVFVLAALQGLILPVYFTRIELPGLLGFVLSAIAAGMLLGAGLYAVLGSRGRRRTWFVIGILGTALGFAVIAPLLSIWTIFAGAFVVGFASGMFSSLMGVLMIERIPEQFRGRVMGTQNAMMTAAAPLGLMGAAVIIEFAGATPAAIAFAAVWVLAAVAGLAVRSLRNLEPASTSDAHATPAVTHAQR